MNGDFARNVSSDFRLTSATPPSEPLATGRPTLSAAQRFCTPVLTTYLRKSTHSGGAFHEHENPSPPPSAALGDPAPPGTDGNGNQPSLLPRPLPLGVRPAMTPGFQCPWSSIAALPLPTSPAELPAPCCAGVARKPRWKGWASSSCFVVAPALTQHGSPNLRLT